MTDTLKRILIIGSKSSESGESQALANMEQFVRDALGAPAGVEIVVTGCHLDEIGFVISNDQVSSLNMNDGTDLKDYDLVFFRGKLAPSINVAASVAQYLDDHHVPHLNTAYAKRRAVGKVAQMFQMAALDLPIAKTVSTNARHLPALIAQQLTYPVIVKDVQGAHGSNNYLVASEEELVKILADQPEVTFMAQEFITNDGDYRVLLVGDHAAIIHRKGQDGSHLNNTSTGGQATLINLDEFPAAILEQSRQFATYCGYEIAGVDAIIDKNTGKHYFLEINSQPQLASGAFIDTKSQLLADCFYDLLGITR